MRALVSYGSSAILHTAVIGLLANWALRETHWEFAVDSGQAITLSASLASAPPAASPEFQPVEIEIVEPPPPAAEATPTDTQAAKQPTEPPDVLDPLGEVEVELDVVAQVEAPTAERRPNESTSPSTATTSASSPAPRREPVAPSTSTAASMAQPAVRFAGASVDRPPRSMPTNRAPDYPPSARYDRSEGRVTLRVAIDDAGEVADIAIHRSSGDYRLDEAALAAVRLWRFYPSVVGGAPAAAEVLVPVRFTLRRS